MLIEGQPHFLAFFQRKLKRPLRSERSFIFLVTPLFAFFPAFDAAGVIRGIYIPSDIWPCFFSYHCCVRMPAIHFLISDSRLGSYHWHLPVLFMSLHFLQEALSGSWILAAMRPSRVGANPFSARNSTVHSGQSTPISFPLVSSIGPPFACDARPGSRGLKNTIVQRASFPRFFRRNRIISSVAPWMATRNPPGSKPQTSQNTIPLDRTIGIFAAARMEPAYPAVWIEVSHHPMVQGYGLLIDFNQNQNGSFHVRKL